MSDVELKECPFCGPKGNPGYAGSEESGYTVQCFTCGTVGGWGDYGYQARDKWNTRTASASMEAKEPRLALGMDVAAPEGDMSCMAIGIWNDQDNLEIKHCVYGAEAEALYRAINMVPELKAALTYKPPAPPTALEGEE